MSRLIALLFAIAGLLATGPAALAAAADDDGPRVRAVIVGNVGYDTQKTGWKPLNGAWNDAMFVATTLLREGVAREDITILSDRPTETTGARGRDIFETDLTPDGIGTRKNILGALKKLVEQAQRGDEILISFSGHGYHQKEMVPGNEPDGADEIFIPLDIGPSVGGEGERLERAIIDDEIGAVIDRIRSKGAHVTYIADFCHSGDTMRNAGDPGPLPATGAEIGLERVERKFSPIGDGDFVKDRAVETSEGGAGWGQFVAMMAAPSDREAKQRLAPQFLPFRERFPLGVLTGYSLANLSNPKVVTYRDLASRVASNISEFHPAAPRPIYDGDLDRPILGGLLKSAGQASESWLVNKPEFPKGTEQLKLDSLMMSAGALQGVTEGSIVELSVPRGSEEIPVLYGKVESAGPYSAKLVPTSFGAIPAERWDNVLDTEGKRFFDAAKLVASIVQRPVDVSFRVALPAAPASPSAAQKAALDALGKIDPAARGATFVAAGEEADLVLAFEGDVLSVSQAGEKATDYGPGIDLAASLARGDELSATLGPVLTRASKYHRVRRLLASQDGIATPEDDPAQKVRVEFFLLRSPEFTAASGDCNPAAAGKFDIRQGAVPEAAISLGRDGATPDGVRTFEKCDILSVRITNASDEELYVNPLYFTSDGAIELKRSLARDTSASSQVMTRYPRRESGVFHVMFDKQLRLQDLQDELIILVSQAGDNRDGGAASAGDGVAVSFARLTQRAVLSGAATGPIADSRRDGDRAAGGPGSPLDQAIDSVLGDASRSGTSGSAGATGAVRYNLTVPGSGREGAR